jgi:hypothetical protein
MKNMSKLIILLSLIMTLPASAMEVYEAQSRCANDAATFYKQQNAGDKFLQENTTYENNYSVKMKSCFLFITTSGLLGNGKAETLYDVYAHRILGMRISIKTEDPPSKCKLSKDDDFATCDETKWQTFIRPYLYNE